MGLASGNVLDRYVVEGLLGSGAMGRVYRATDTRLRRAVAIKILEPAAAASGAETAAALREARAAAAIVHPNVTAVFDADQSGGTSFIVMELVPGTALRAHVGDESVPVGVRVRWLVEIAAALAAAHQVGVVHRDIKPENVVVRDDGLVKVLDFGVARFASASTPALGIAGIGAVSPGQTGLAGTPAYMAPEQIQGANVDARADQFAWGVVAYELLTGALPWNMADGVFGILASIIADTPRPLPEGLPPELCAAVMRALAKPRAERFPSMLEAATALAPFATGPLPLLGLAPDSHTRAPRIPPPPREPAPRVELPRASRQVAPLAYSVPPIAPVAPFDELHEPHDTTPPPSLRTLAARMVALPPCNDEHDTEPNARIPCDPDFLAPVDLDAHLALLPTGASCKGLFFIAAVRLAAKARTVTELHQTAGIPERRYIAFRDYPMADNLRLSVAAARCAFPSLPLGQALRRLGQTAFETVMGSHVGKTLFGVLDGDIERLLLRWPKAYELFYGFGEVTAEATGPGLITLRAHRFPALLATYQVGVLEGALRRCRAAGKVRVDVETLADGTFEIELE